MASSPKTWTEDFDAHWDDTKMNYSHPNEKQKNNIALRLYRLKYEQLNELAKEFVDDVVRLIADEVVKELEAIPLHPNFIGEYLENRIATIRRDGDAAA